MHFWQLENAELNEKIKAAKILLKLGYLTPKEQDWPEDYKFQIYRFRRRPKVTPSEEQLNYAKQNSELHKGTKHILDAYRIVLGIPSRYTKEESIVRTPTQLVE